MGRGEEKRARRRGGGGVRLWRWRKEGGTSVGIGRVEFLGERGGKGESLLVGIPSWRLVLLILNDACIAASGHGLGCGRGGRRDDGGIYTHNWSSRFHSCVKYLP